MIKKIRRHMFVFVAHRDIPAAPHHHHWLLSRVEWKLYADIGTVLATACRRAITAREAIRLPLAGKPLASAP